MKDDACAPRDRGDWRSGNFRKLGCPGKTWIKSTTLFDPKEFAGKKSWWSRRRHGAGDGNCDSACGGKVNAQLPEERVRTTERKNVEKLQIAGENRRRTFLRGAANF